ncbi:hypothetical protein AcW1_003003 [Taiwanofungus camphoratus]|nr:hypothetical protein AcV5_001811 [Antrodia cinnamomea]KAI0925304.1 hypothetical protein AcV7_005580 [Antrodia cinnamomea]KAI0942352.1 hypothetical protein AcW1_003003 [Antrodia cinnamomea]
MRPAFKSPQAIDITNFHEHLGDEEFYNAYLEFFSSALLKDGMGHTIEEYIFSLRFNINAPEHGKPPMRMLNRFLAGLLHPLIHTGYGAEFGLLGMVAEGLAQTAIHHDDAPVLIPESIFEYAAAASSDAANAAVSRLTSLLPSLVLDKVQNAVPVNEDKQSKTSVNALTVLAQILHNPDFTPASIGLPCPDHDDVSAFRRVLTVRGERLCNLAQAWTVDGTNAEEVADKIEELIWMNVLVYGVGGWGGRGQSSDGDDFNADFFLMHLVTSVLFMHSLTAYLSPTSTSILLRTYFMNCLAWWVARGRPAIPIRNFYAAVSPRPTEHGAPHATPAGDTLRPTDASPNPWLPIVQTTLVHPDDHLCKLQRGLAHFASLYGTRRAGHLAELAKDSAAPLEGADVLDGTLFVRVAGLTAERLGWMREGQKRRQWDFGGFFDCQ